MNVLHIINVRWYNATAWYALSLADVSNKNGETHFILSIPNAPVLYEAEKRGIANYAFDFNSSNPFKILKAIISFEKFLKTNDVDIIIAHRGEFFWYLCLRRLFIRKNNVLIRVRGDDRPPTSDFISKYFYKKLTNIIIVTASIIRKNFIDNLNLNPDKVVVIHGGVDRNIFYPDINKRVTIRKEFGYTEDDCVVSVIGRFDPVKGHSIFFKAMGMLYKVDKKLKLLLVGFPENISNDDIMDMAKENGVDKITTITGRRDDIPSIINAIDIGVVSSINSEKIARVAFEIIATEKRIMSSDIGVLPDIIPAENIYKFDDPEDLFNKILKCMKVDKIYSYDEFYSQYKAVVDKVISL